AITTESMARDVLERLRMVPSCFNARSARRTAHSKAIGETPTAAPAVRRTGSLDHHAVDVEDDHRDANRTSRCRLQRSGDPSSHGKDAPRVRGAPKPVRASPPTRAIS